MTVFCAGQTERVQVYRQVREIGQRPRRQEIVDERQRRLEAARQRRVVGRADERVQPHQSMAASLEPRDLVAQLAPDRRDPIHRR